MNTLSRVQRFIRRTDCLLQRHPRGLTAAVVVLLLGTGMTAFGVAPRTADPADLPRSIVTQSITPAAFDAQLQALDTHALELYRHDLTRGSDTADSLLRRLGVDDPEAAAFLRKDAVARRLLEGRPGKMVRVLTHKGRISQLVARSPADADEELSTHFTRLTITRDAFGLTTRIEQAPLASQARLGSGTIQTSLFAAADESRVPEAVTAQLAELFATDIDFERELRRGDTFTVLYEALTADGEPIAWGQASGRVLAAQFVNGGKQYDAVWFQDAVPGGPAKGSYYGLDGRSKSRMFLSSPMAFSRVTSGFRMRFHPVLQSWRAHLGVDYAAPTGTAVRTVGEGVVEFAGQQGGYGNLVVVKHTGERETRYAHLSRMDVRPGQRVEQGQRIGAVGATGWATGPHLHFEFRVRGEHVDPTTIARASEALALSPAARGRFAEIAEAAREQLASAPQVAEASFE